ncbi:MAG: hypothetical protein MUE44_36690 [Oscillatoriaceae cyanobacterium Prado104]|nr:hypothetical protein [Oscillatoriaceae cyanobacterium Prado104]
MIPSRRSEMLELRDITGIIRFSSRSETLKLHQNDCRNYMIEFAIEDLGTPRSYHRNFLMELASVFDRND